MTDTNTTNFFSKRLAGCLIAALLTVHAGAPAFAECPALVKSITCTDLAGRAASPSCGDYRVMVINFWATWCGPCRIEIPHLNELYREYRKQGLAVIGISLDMMPADVLQQYIKDMKIAYPVYLGSAEELRTRFSIPGIPATVVIDGRGVVRETFVGYHSKNALQKVIREIINAEPAKS